MLNYRSVSISVVILAGLALLAAIFLPPAAWTLLPLAAVYLCLMVAGSVKICSGFYLKVYCRVRTSENTAALTFDDGPDEKITPEVLRILEANQVKATFFLIGWKAEAHPELVRLIVSQGHEVGIHSYGHAFWFDLYSRKKMERDLRKAGDLIQEITGRRPSLFRPPYGVTNPALAAAVKKSGYRVIGWSVRSFDTSARDEERVVQRVMKGLHPGAVILFHDTLEIAPRVLERILVKARERGYRFVGANEWDSGNM